MNLIKKQLQTKITFVNINDERYLLKFPFTILELINYLNFNKNVIVIDYNGLILAKDLWKQTSLKNEDSLEILSIAGGG